MLNIIRHEANLEKFKPSDIVGIDTKELSVDQVEKMKAIIDLNKEAFSLSEEDTGRCDLEHDISLTSNIPFKSRAYRMPHAQQGIAEEAIEKMLRMGIISESQSDYASPIVLVKKKDGDTRFCVDFRKLNEITVKDSYPMPYIDEQLERLGGNRFFTSLDLNSAY